MLMYLLLTLSPFHPVIVSGLDFRRLHFDVVELVNAGASKALIASDGRY